MTAACQHAYDPASVDFLLFSLFLDGARVRRGKSLRQVAREAELMPDTVERAIAARDPGEDEYFALCAWIGIEPGFFMEPARGIAHAG
ncbi:MAG: hypothetical protein WBA36_03720 [Mesorhizobium sp.]